MEAQPRPEPPKFILPKPKERNPTEVEVKEHARTHDADCGIYRICLYEKHPWLA